MMPELKDFVPRQSYAQRSGSSQYGRVVERQIPDHYLIPFDEQVS
jgi:hypothetical protein